MKQHSPDIAVDHRPDTPYNTLDRLTEAEYPAGKTAAEFARMSFNSTTRKIEYGWPLIRQNDDEMRMIKGKLTFCLLLSVPFWMGCKDRTPEAGLEAFHNSVDMVMVKLPYGDYVSKYETRQSEFEAIMGYNPSTHQNPDYPVHTLTGREAIEFCKRLTDYERERGMLLRGFVYSLPTYKQWRHYVSDAPLKGSITPRGQDGRKLQSPLAVGSGERNRFGLYDLRGNVAEYLIDLYPNSESQMIVGASWLTHQTEYYSTRNKAGFTSPDDKSIHVGFRCVLIPKEE